MAIYKAFSPNVEMYGQTIVGFVAGMGAFTDMAMQLLKKHGISNPQPDQWYPQQSYLDAFKEMAAKTGPKTVQQVGKRVIDVAPFPPGIDTLEKALAAVPQSYKMNHRGGNAGGYSFTKTGERAAKMVCNIPYPDEWDMGVLLGVAAKFAPGKVVKIAIDESQPTRKKGADSTTFLISW